MAFCNKCGNQLIEGCQFCNSCGAPVAGANVASAPVGQELWPNNQMVVEQPRRRGLPGWAIALIVVGSLLVVLLPILIGVLSPAYLKYVEKSRKSTDVTAIGEMMTAANKVTADVEYWEHFMEGTKLIITIKGGQATTSVLNSQGYYDDNANRYWAEYSNGSKITLKSKTGKSISNRYVGVVQSNGSVIWSYDHKDALISYSNDFANRFRVNNYYYY